MDYIRCCFDIHLLSRLIPIWIGSILIPLCLSTSIFSYTKIFVKLCRHQTQVQDHAQQEQPNQPAPLNIESYRKVVSSVLWVQCTLVACYLPFPIVRALLDNSKLSPSSSLIICFDVATSLIYLNSSLNPILYCWKISEVKQAVKETIRVALCCLPS